MWVMHPAAEGFEELDGHADGGDVDFAEVGLGVEVAVAVFEGGEGDGAVGVNDGGGWVAHRLAGLGVEPGGNIDGEDEGAGVLGGVDVGDELLSNPLDWAGEAGAEEGVDDEAGRRGRVGEATPSVDHGEVHLGDDVEVDFGIACDAIGRGCHDDGGAVAQVMEVAGSSEPVASVVARAGCDEDVVGSGRFEHVDRMGA